MVVDIDGLSNFEVRILPDVGLYLGSTNIVIKRAFIFDAAQHKLVILVEDFDSSYLVSGKNNLGRDLVIHQLYIYIISSTGRDRLQ